MPDPENAQACCPGPDRVTVVRVPLDPPAQVLAALQAPLCADERARAARFRFAGDRRRWMAARGALRVLLGRCLEMPPTEVRLRCGAHGKPELHECHGRPELRFSLAHSHDRALVALTAGREVGVDIERVRADLDHLAIARALLGPEVTTELAALAAAERAEAFAVAWTRYEAHAKALGVGLTAPPPADAPVHHLVTLRPWPEYVAAVAAPGVGWTVELLDFTPPAP